MFLKIKAPHLFFTLKSYSGTWLIARAACAVMKLDFWELFRLKTNSWKFLLFWKFLLLSKINSLESADGRRMGEVRGEKTRERKKIICEIFI